MIVGLVSLSPIFVYGANSENLVISQVQVKGDGGANDEFIEIWNPTIAAISLDGWSIQYKSSSGSFPLTSGKKNLPDVSIPANSYYLIAKSDYNGAVVADHIHSSFSLSGASSGATIFLINDNQFIESGADPNIVDKLGYGIHAGNSPEGEVAPTPDTEEVLLRGTDTDNNANDFTLSIPDPKNSSYVVSVSPVEPPSSSGGSSLPSEIPTVTYSSDIIISEFLPNPDGSDSGEEWVELYNKSAGSVDLSGWILDDEGKNGAIGSSAFVIEEDTSIGPQEYLVIILPEKSFALNNSGGDEVRLFWPDGQLFEAVIYTDSADSDESYARNLTGEFQWTTLVTKGEANQFAIPQIEEIEKSKDMQEEQTETSTYIDFRINEIFPNPEGSDSGYEWVEILNFGNAQASTHNWILDDGQVGEKIGGSAYTIQSPKIDPGGVVHILIPSGKFAMNNTGEETVRLFSPAGVLIDSVVYDGAEEGMSYSLGGDGVWAWVIPTPSKPNPEVALSNNLATADTLIYINEVWPEPQDSSQEFVELINLGDNSVDLSGWTLADNARSYTIASFSLEPGEIRIFTKAETKLALNNFGQETVRLTDPNGTVVAQIEYEDAPKNQSYNLSEDGEYFWSVVATPGKPNQIQAGGKVRGTKLPVTGATNKHLLWIFGLGIIFCYSLYGRKITNA
jgi:hypothetical protein